MDRFIDRQIARANRNLLTTSLVLLALVATAGVIFARYFENYFAGPYPSTLEEIARAPTPDHLKHYYVALEGELIDTGYQHITTQVDKYTHQEKSRKVTGSYLALRQGEQYMLVRADTDLRETKSARISGYVREPESVDSEVLAGIRKDEADLQGKLSRHVLDMTGFRTAGTIGLVAIGLALLLAGRNLRGWSARRSRPEEHPIWKGLARFGEPRGLAAQIDGELHGSEVSKIGGATLTRSWLLRQKAFGIDLLPFERLVWCHKKVTSRNGAKTYEAMLYDRDGRMLSVSSREKNVDALLDELGNRRAPWVIAGWSTEIERAWKTQRAQMIAAVDERRQKPAQVGGTS